MLDRFYVSLQLSELITLLSNRKPKQTKKFQEMKATIQEDVYELESYLVENHRPVQDKLYKGIFK